MDTFFMTQIQSHLLFTSVASGVAARILAARKTRVSSLTQTNQR